MVLLYGTCFVDEKWHVTERQACLFLRAYYVLEGTAIYSTEEEQHRLEPGHLYCFPTNTPYAVRRDADKPFRVFYLHTEITPHMLDRFLDMNVAESELLTRMMHYFIQYCADVPDEVTSPMTAAVFSSFVEYLMVQNVFSVQRMQMTQSLQYILDHLGESLTLDILSEVAGYHPQYYLRLFTKTQGITPHQFIISYRMRRGFYYLLQGKTVAQAAALVGFSEAKNFSRAFQQYFGMKPSKVNQSRYLSL